MQSSICFDLSALDTIHAFKSTGTTRNLRDTLERLAASEQRWDTQTTRSLQDNLALIANVVEHSRSKSTYRAWEHCKRRLRHEVFVSTLI